MATSVTQVEIGSPHHYARLQMQTQYLLHGLQFSQSTIQNLISLCILTMINNIPAFRTKTKQENDYG